jgi:hypothetical protein
MLGTGRAWLVDPIAVTETVVPQPRQCQRIAAVLKRITDARTDAMVTPVRSQGRRRPIVVWLKRKFRLCAARHRARRHRKRVWVKSAIFPI